VELLVVVAIVAILAAIALPRVRDTQDQAFVATLRSDLGALRMAQESYRVSGGVGYAESVEALGELFAPSEGVTVTILGAEAQSWSAEATHSASPQTCSLNSEDGVVVCADLESGDVE
jgi:type II secretory pathway pseudopilin PulG